tara:strand:+ start:67 stop:1044 length:978 start_codon:yes stop_codon:yes gene_type:complete
MSQADLVIANQSGSAFRADLNNQLAALGTLMSGSSAPSTTYAYMLWADSSNGVLKIRNSGNNSWVSLFKLDGTDICKLTGSTNNEITTVTGAGNIQGETNLTFSGSELKIIGDIAIEDNTPTITLKDLNDSNSTGIVQHTSGNLKLKSDSTNILSGSSVRVEIDGSEKVRIDDTGDLKIFDGDLVIGTAGHGIDFSVNTGTAGMDSELLDFYEEGSWTPAFNSNDNGGTFPVSTYIRVGRLVCVTLHATVGGGSDSSGFKITGLPFAPDKNGCAPVATNCNIACHCRIYDSQTYLEVLKFDATDVTYANLSDKFIMINATYRCNP